MNFMRAETNFQFRFKKPLRAANWIVSYPRSGNTFLRTLIANYFSGLERPLDLDEIAATTRGEHDEQLWRELTGKYPAERSLEEEWSKREAYHGRLREMTGPSLALIKSHTLNCELKGRPAYWFTPEDRILHVVRHPCDVAISYAHFAGIEIDQAIARMLRRGAFVADPPERGYEVLGSWSENARSWMQPLAAPLHRIRYFDLVNRTVEILKEVVAFLGYEPDDTQVEKAVEYSRFERLSSQERERGFVEQSELSSEPFFREGRPGQWLKQMTIEQALRILGDDPELIDLLGFKRLTFA